MIMLYMGIVGSVLEYGSYATIGKGPVSENNDSSGTHAFDPKQWPEGPQWHSTSSEKICVPEF
jgi:hypothetical protein